MQPSAHNQQLTPRRLLTYLAMQLRIGLMWISKSFLSEFPPYFLKF